MTILLFDDVLMPDLLLNDTRRQCNTPGVYPLSYVRDIDKPINDSNNAHLLAS